MASDSTHYPKPSAEDYIKAAERIERDLRTYPASTADRFARVILDAMTQRAQMFRELAKRSV